MLRTEDIHELTNDHVNEQNATFKRENSTYG
uniref:Uncharacterized protein n=1 Tax=Anguilla anguilla TaxID=7936 RepID=A0A0E9USM8_ANGAN